MKLNVDLSELKLASAKMGGLPTYLQTLREVGKNYKDGLELAKEYTLANNGKVSEENEVTILELFNDTAACFQPYPDINKFYFEM